MAASSMPRTLAFAGALFALVGCQSAAQHAADVRQAQDGDRLTVGTVQREIRIGMSGADVAQVLGAPNIVTTDDQRRETWVYDKISTDRVYSTSSGGVNMLVLGGGLLGNAAAAGGIGGVGAGSSAGASSTSQRTLTVVIRYDGDKKVRDFAYHTSRF